MLSFSKTRIAPTPSGYLHAGNALNFLLTAALAERVGARVLLRIDDLDRERYRTAYVNDVFETLQFLNIYWNEGPYNLEAFEQTWSQRHRMHLYIQALEKLREGKKVFACLCSRTQIAACTCLEKRVPLDTPGASWRLLTDEAPLVVNTLDGKTLMAALPDTIKDFVVRRKDGVPAYQLASVVDDVHFGIDAVIRGADLWPSTLAQLYLANQLNETAFASIRFYHHPLLSDDKGEKLSKSAGALSVKYWREQGRTAKDYLAYLGTLLQTGKPVHNTTDLLHIRGL